MHVLTINVLTLSKIHLYYLMWYLTLQGDNSVKSAEHFNDVVFTREY